MLLPETASKDTPLLFAPEAGSPLPAAWTAPGKKPSGRVPAAEMESRRPVRIAVDGPLRAGKSSLAGLLATRLGIEPVVEPEGNPFLPRFYAGEPGMAFAAQMWFLRKRADRLQEAASLRGSVVTDCTLAKDGIFAHLTLSDPELAIYKEARAALPPGLFEPDLVVYLDASPAVLRERLRRKGVPSERRIHSGYTEQVCEAYRYFYGHYSASRLLVVDTDAIDFVGNPAERELLLNRILAPVYGREHYAPMARTA